jgi:hypothetical protein
MGRSEPGRVTKQRPPARRLEMGRRDFGFIRGMRRGTERQVLSNDG